MFGFKKKENKDMNEIKEQISRPFVPELPKTMPPIERLPMELGARTAPLFIKVENYKEITQGINSIRPFIINIKNLLERDKQLDDAKIEIREKINENMNNIESILSNLTSSFPAPEENKNISNHYYEEPEDFTGLESEIDNLRKDINKMK